MLNLEYMVSALKLCFALLLLSLTYLSPKDVLADWNADFIPPSIVIGTNCGNGFTCNGPITITISCADAQSGCNFTNYTINNTANRFTGSSIQESKSDPGTYTIRASGYDNTGNLGTAPVYTFTIRSPYPTLNVSCSTSPNPAQTNNYIYWTANPTGGTGSYSYNWSITDGWGGYGQQIWSVHGSTGTKTGTVTVTSGAQTKTATCTVQINNPPPPPPPGNFNVTTANSQCQNSKPYTSVSWTKSNNATYYTVYRQRLQPGSYSDWYLEYVTNTTDLSYTDYGVADMYAYPQRAYYYYIVAWGNSSPPATAWSNFVSVQNCNQNPANFTINPAENICAGAYETYPSLLVSWQRSTYATWYSVYKYIVNPNNSVTFLNSYFIYDPTNYFYDYDVQPGRRYSYYVSAVNPSSPILYRNANNSPRVSPVVQECNKGVYGYVYLKDTNTPYRGPFTVDSADRVSINYSGTGFYYQVLTPVPKGGRSYYALYLYPPAGYKITSAPHSYGCGNDRTNIFPCSSIIYSNPESYRFNPFLEVSYYVEPIPPPPINGGWSTWSPITCPTACGLPASTQTRTCTNPAPANGGAACVGSATAACSATTACAAPFIQTQDGDVHSNVKIEGN